VRKRLAAACVLVAIAAASPSRAGEIIVGVTAGTAPELVSFDTAAPGNVIERLPVSGMVSGEQIRALDMRPATGELWAFTTLNRILILDPETAVATPAGPQIDPALFGTLGQTGWDFNPTVDRLRLVNSGETNFRYNPLTFALVDSDPGTLGTQPDTTLGFAGGDPNAGDDPNIVAEAYDRNDSDPATGTTLFGIDAGNDVLVTQGGVNGTPSPNGGQLFTVGALGVNVTDASLDIGLGGAAFAATQGAGETVSTLRSVNLATGATTSLGQSPGLLAGITVATGGAISTPATSTIAAEGGAQVTVEIARSGQSLGPVSLGFRTSDGSAAAGEDYTATSGVLAFEQGETSKQVTIPITQDAAAEGIESFTLELGPATGGALVSEPRHLIQIVDDDQSAVTPDTTAPAFLIAPSPPASARKLLRSRALVVEFACSEACLVDLGLSLKSKQVGAAVGYLSGAGVASVNLLLSEAGRKALQQAVGKRRSGSLSLTLGATALDGAGNQAADAATLRIPR
jgi:hypothetical protein